MGTIPTATEIRNFLEGYGISISVLSDEWIENRVSNFIVPFVEEITGFSLDSETSVTEYLSGTGESMLLLSRKPVNSLVSIAYVTGGDYNAELSLNGVVLMSEEGLIKSISNITEGGQSRTFRKGVKNIKVVYKVGSDEENSRIKEAIIYLTSEQLLGFIGARTGGGTITVQGFSRNFGTRGKWQDIRNDLKRQAMFLLKKYNSSVVGY